MTQVIDRADRLNYWVLVAVLTLAGTLGTHRAAGQDRWDRVIDLTGRWKFTIGDKPMWAERYYNDTQWEEVYVPSKWEEEGFHGYDGYAWYRISFNGANLPNKEETYSLILGYIDDVDEVYLNGKKIGASGGFPPRYHTAYNALRNYVLPNDLIDFAGRNVIAVRVFDEGLEGGIIRGNVGIYSNRNDRGLVVNLRGMWDFYLTGKRAIRMPTIDEQAVAALLSGPKSNWTKINVPGAWEHQGFHDYDGTAWYYKEFVIPKQLAGQDLVVVLGKIDDSDRTFLNGKLIGAMTAEWQQLRVYHITPEQYKVGAVNSLVVFVDDPQGFGGIYEGPVGIMKQTDFTRFMRWKN
jgi:sialate O-acetylesterase